MCLYSFVLALAGLEVVVKRFGGGSLQASLGMHNPNLMKIRGFFLKLLMKIHQFGFHQRNL